MAERIAYRVVIWRETETRMWAVHVPDLDLLTQARRIDEVERMARSIIALHLGTDDQRSFGIEVETRLPGELVDELARARELREQADEANRQAAALSRDAARRLADQGLTIRDIGAILRVSFQRASQLLGQRAS